MPGLPVNSRMVVVRNVTRTASTISSVRSRALASQTTATPEAGAIREMLSGWTTSLG